MEEKQSYKEEKEKALKTIDLEIAVMNWIGIRANLVIPNVYWGISMQHPKTRKWLGLHECDILSLSKSNYATEVEIKVTKGDLLKDKDKGHGHNSDLIKYLYFAVPEKLEDLAQFHIPERAGLLVLGDGWGSVHCVRSPEVNSSAIKWPADKRLKLAELGCMRILKLNLRRLLFKN